MIKLFEQFNNEQEMIDICKEYNIQNYTINPDGSIDVNGDVRLIYMGLDKLPLRFNRVSGNFICARNRLTSLEGSPKYVGGFFDCTNNQLDNLEGSPKEVGSDFYCQYNNIKSFEYFPSFIRNYFWCDRNPIYEVWKLFQDTSKIELLNDFDIFRDEHTDEPAIFIDRLNDFLLTIGKDPVEKVKGYKNI